MSEDTKRVEESALSSDSVLDLLENWYQVPALGVVLAFMFWVRMQSYDSFFRDGRIYFSGNDPWYHFREVMWTVEHYPALMPYDPWTGFPTGTTVGQFGTLFDQLMATAALIVGLGDPSTQTVATVVLITPAVLGTLVAIPTYFIGKRLGGSRFAGLVGAVLLALLPGLFLQRGLVGTADHNIAEPLFQSTAVLAMMVAVSVGERERPVYEQVVARDWDALREPLAWSVLAGVATALYLWVWPPGVVIIGIFGVFFAVKLSADYVRGVSPDHLAFVAATSMAVTALLALVPLGESSFSAVTASLIQPTLALAVGAGAAFMAWFGREWESRDVAESLYPAAVGGLILVAAAGVRLLLPGLWTQLSNNTSRLFFFVDQSATTGTVAEAQPFLSRAAQYGIEWYWVIYLEYGLAFFTAMVAALVMVARAFVSNEHRAELLLVLVWSALITSMAFTQVRFNYYLAVPVAVLNAYLIAEVVRFVGVSDARGRIEDVESYQVLAVVAVLLVVLAPLVATTTVGSQGQVGFGTATEIGDSAGPGSVTQWSESLFWMKNNTPAEGTYGGADNEMEVYGTFDRTDDFDYPAGAYGVMSWWDYGHWITTQGDRIPVANPFQQHAGDAADYLLAPNESAANDVRLRMSENDAETRFVMVDWQMASPHSKFGAPVVFYNDADLRWQDMYTRVVNRRGQLAFYLKHQRYYESQMVRLFMFHGSAVQPQPIVVDYQPVNADGYGLMPSGENAQVIREFNTTAEARAFVEEDGSAQVGGYGPYPNEYVEALEHYRLVQASESRSPQSLQLGGTPAHVKVFERVPGATVAGEGPANATVTASVTMTVPNQGTQFQYTQRAETGPDGEFSMTLPYSSTGYENWGPERGYTNVSVRAAGPYVFSTPVEATGPENLTYVRHVGTANVTEAQVIGENESSVPVSLEEQTVSEPGGANNTSANDTATNSSSLAPVELTPDRSGDAALASPSSAAWTGPTAASGPPVAPTRD